MTPKAILIPVVTSGLIFFAIALIMVASQSIKQLTSQTTISFDSTGQTTPDTPDLVQFTARGGADLGVVYIPAVNDDAPLVIVVHGSGWHGGAYTSIGGHIADNLGYNVLIPNLRGHGTNPIRRGDVDYIGQLEDDLADLIKIYRKPNQAVYMVGHSSGGGLVIRFAGGEHGALLSKAVLIAPFLKYNAPTARENAGGWSHVLTRRIIGLSMLNSVGIKVLNHLHIIQFNFPAEILDGAQGKTATTSYSFRMNASFSPRNDYLSDIAALPEFLLLAGKNDEAFHADVYEPTMSEVNSNGSYELIEGTDHLGILVHQDALARISNFLSE